MSSLLLRFLCYTHAEMSQKKEVSEGRSEGSPRRNMSKNKVKGKCFHIMGVGEGKRKDN